MDGKSGRPILPARRKWSPIDYHIVLTMWQLLPNMIKCSIIALFESDWDGRQGCVSNLPSIYSHLRAIHCTSY